RALHFHTEVKLTPALRSQRRVWNHEHTERRIAKVAQQVTLGYARLAITRAPTKVRIDPVRQADDRARCTGHDSATRRDPFYAFHEIDQAGRSRRTDLTRNS